LWTIKNRTLWRGQPPPKQKKRQHTWTDWNLIRESLRTSALKEGAVVAVGQWSPQERPSHKKMSQAEPLEKREW
jgi:hypothetical protein